MSLANFSDLLFPIEFVVSLTLATLLGEFKSDLLKEPYLILLLEPLSTLLFSEPLRVVGYSLKS